MKRTPSASEGRMPDDTLLTTSAVARTLGRSEQAVRSYANAGRLPVMRTESGLRLFNREAVERLAQELQKERSSQ